MPSITPTRLAFRWLWMSIAGSILLSSLDVRASMAADPKPTSQRFIPADALVGYFEFDGLDAHNEAWKATAAHGLLVKTTAGSMMTELARQVVDRLLKTVPATKLTGDDLIALQDHLIRRGFVLALHSHQDGAVSLTVILNGLGRKEVRERFERLLQLLLAPGESSKIPSPARLRDRNVYQVTDRNRGNVNQIQANLPPIPGGDLPGLQAPPRDEPEAPHAPWLSWWFERDDLILIAEASHGSVVVRAPADKKAINSAPRGHLARVLDVIEAKHPNVTAHPGFLDALAEGKDIKGFEADGVFFIDPGKDKDLLTGLLGLSDLPKDREKLGLDGIKRIVGRWGFQGKALLTDIRIEAPFPRKGLVAWVDQPGFRKDRLPPIPRDTGAFAVDSLDLLASYRRLIESLKVLEPRIGDEIGQIERAIREATGIELREDLLSHLGPTWSVFPVPTAEQGHDERDKFDWTEYVLVAGVNAPEAFGKLLDSLATRVNQSLRDAEKTEGKANAGNQKPEPAMLLLERLPAPDRGYRLTSPAQLVFWLNDEMQPTILVGKSYVAFASNLERARQALASEGQAGSDWRPAGELISTFEVLPEKLTFLSVGDPRDSAVPDGIAGLPRMVQSLSTLLGDVTDFDAPSATNFLAAIGVPRPGSFRVRIDPSQIPKPEALRAYLFPSVLAASVDDRGLRLLSREAFPFACMGNMASLKSSMKWSGGKGFKRDVKLLFGLGN